VGLVFTGEHARDDVELPLRDFPQLRYFGYDRNLVDALGAYPDHMRFDPGIEDLVYFLASEHHGDASIFDVGRLAIEGNRYLTANDAHANEIMVLPGIVRRVLGEHYWHPHRIEVARKINGYTGKPPNVAIFLHSFTPNHEVYGPREVEFGVIHPDNGPSYEFGKMLVHAMRILGYDSRSNEPYNKEFAHGTMLDQFEDHTLCVTTELSQKYIGRDGNFQMRVKKDLSLAIGYALNTFSVLPSGIYASSSRPSLVLPSSLS